MRHHPALTDISVPRFLELGDYRLSILGPDDVDEDYAAVMESAERLTGCMGGDWPQGLTHEDNWIDLAWHLREFDARRSFAWIARDGDEQYMGCVYVFPRFADALAADVFIWVRSAFDPARHEAALGKLMADWLRGPAWPEMTCHFHFPKDSA